MHLQGDHLAIAVGNEQDRSASCGPFAPWLVWQHQDSERPGGSLSRPATPPPMFALQTVAPGALAGYRGAMRIVLACLMVGVGLVGEPRHASAFMVIGTGLESCGTWTANRRYPNSIAAVMDEQWILGFLAGVGDAIPSDADPLRGVDAQAVWAWVDNYCHANPLDQIIRAGEAIFRAHPQ